MEKFINEKLNFGKALLLRPDGTLLSLLNMLLNFTQDDGNRKCSRYGSFSSQNKAHFNRTLSFEGSKCSRHL